MVASTYDTALAGVLAHEGGYVNHPADPGGPTNFGITLATYRGVKPGATAADVQAMTRAEAAAIYRARYWNALRCDELPAGVDYAVFDYGVNSGTARAGRVLRRSLGLASTRSTVDDPVIAAAREHDAAALVRAICDERLAFLRGLKTWPTFGTGWSRRVESVRTRALALTQGTQPSSRAPVVAGGIAAAAVVAATADASALMAAFAGLAVLAVAVAVWMVWRQEKG